MSLRTKLFSRILPHCGSTELTLLSTLWRLHAQGHDKAIKGRSLVLSPKAECGLTAGRLSERLHCELGTWLGWQAGLPADTCHEVSSIAGDLIQQDCLL